MTVIGIDKETEIGIDIQTIGMRVHDRTAAGVETGNGIDVTAIIVKEITTDANTTDAETLGGETAIRCHGEFAFAPMPRSCHFQKFPKLNASTR